MSFFSQRRLSDPSANLSVFVRGGWQQKRPSEGSRARSENEGLDTMVNTPNHIQAGDLRDGKPPDITTILLSCDITPYSAPVASF